MSIFAALWEAVVTPSRWPTLVSPPPAVPVVEGEPLYPSRRIYIAARYSRKEEAETLALDFELSGHTVTSTWHRPDSRSPTWRDREIAEQDLFDLLSADTLVSLAEQPRTPTRGGRLVGFGIALALGKRVIIYGDGEGLYETVFHSLPEVEHCPPQLWVLLNTLTKPGPTEDVDDTEPLIPGIVATTREELWQPIWDSGPIEVPGPEGSR